MAVALAKSPRVTRVYVAPGNGGTATEGGKVANVILNTSNHETVAEFVRREGCALVAVGPEDPLAAGIADSMAAAGIPCFGPSQAAAKLEGSKAHSKAFMVRHGLPTAVFRTFSDYSQVRRRCRGGSCGKSLLGPACHRVYLTSSPDSLLFVSLIYAW